MLPLTPYTLRSAYKFLCSTPPFYRWNLPDADDVSFRIVRDRSLHGWHKVVAGRNIIGISRGVVGHTQSLITSMAHEMVHMHQYECKMPINHGLAFQKLAQHVCKIHGFDPKAF